MKIKIKLLKHALSVGNTKKQKKTYIENASFLKLFLQTPLEGHKTKQTGNKRLNYFLLTQIIGPDKL